MRKKSHTTTKNKKSTKKKSNFNKNCGCKTCAPCQAKIEQMLKDFSKKGWMFKDFSKSGWMWK
jgi:hypothetical protein